MGYTVTFQGHKGWPAVLGILGAVVGALTPYVHVLPVPAQVAVGIAGAIVAGYSNKPGAIKEPVVSIDPNTTAGTVTVRHDGDTAPATL